MKFSTLQFCKKTLKISDTVKAKIDVNAECM